MRIFKGREQARAPHPSDCGLQTLQITEEREDITTPSREMDKASPAYAAAQKRHHESIGTSYHPDYQKPIRDLYEEEGGTYAPITTEKVTNIGRISCRRMEQAGIEPLTAEGRTPIEAAKQVGDVVATLYCKTCPYFGMDHLRAANYDAEVAAAERTAADQLLAAEQARKEIANINRHLELPQ